MLPTSPEAAMLGRFGDIPIGYYTGTADISIPLYTIKEAGVEIPIVLRYHSSGIKVEDEASNVGLGWDLDPGGSIIQIINGKADGPDGDYLPSRDPAGYAFLKGSGLNSVYFERPDIDLIECHSNNSGDSFDLLAFLEQNEGQPDIYQYSFAGHSGKFSINPETGQIVILNKSTDIIFSRTPQQGWMAKTMDGNTFYFSVSESSRLWGASDRSTYTFKLTKVELHTGKVINLDYQDGYYDGYAYSESFHSDYPLGLGADNNYVNHSLDPIQHYTKTLTKITTDQVEIDFNLEDRIDMNTENSEGIAATKRIQSVDIKDVTTGLKKKSFLFNYDYFTSSSTVTLGTYLTYLTSFNTNAFSKRLKLLSLQELGYTVSNQAVSKPAYQFTYNETIQLPLKASFSRDFWGYYNGAGSVNTKMIPDLSFFYYSEDNDYLDMPVGMIHSANGANRSPDAASMQAAMLTKVTYPTGGFSEFDYEPHYFNNHIYPDISQLAGMITNGYAHDTNSPDESSAYTFTIQHSQIITFNNIITRGPDNALGFFDLQPATIILTKTLAGVTTTLKTWQMSSSPDQPVFEAAGGTFEWNESVALTYEAGAQYTITTSLPDALGPQNIFPHYASVSSNFNYENTASQNHLTNSYGGGLRVKEIRSYTASGQLAGKKVIKYVNTDNTNSGILMSPLKSLFKRMMYGVQPEGLNTLFEQKNVWFISSESVIPFSTSAAGGVVGYSRVEESDIAPNGTLNGKHVYNYNNIASDSHANVPDNPNLLNGMIDKEEIFKNELSTPLIEIKYTYTDKQYSYFNGAKIASIYIGANPCDVPPSFDLHFNSIHQWQFYVYPIYSHWYVLQSKQTKELFNGNLLTKTEQYEYNSKGQLTKVTSQNSKQQPQASEYLYPVDNPSDPMTSELISRNLYDQLQQQRITVNNIEVSRENISYRLESNQVVQNAISRSNWNAAPYTEVIFDRYGAYKTLLQFNKNGPPTSLLWSYAYSKPIAEIRNVDFATLELILGAASINSFAAQSNPAKASIDAFLAPLFNNPLIPNAFITKYSYDSLNGLTSQTDPKGETTYYEYDDFQRLKNVKDQEGNIVKNYQYHYKN